MPDKFKNFFSENLGVKLVSLVLAYILWFFVVGEKEEEVGFMVVPLYKGLPENMVMIETSPAAIGVRVKGPKTFVHNVNASDIQAEIDLSKVAGGTNSVTVNADDISAPRGVKVVRVTPGSVTVEMEELVTAVLPINVKLSGKLPEGYTISEVNVTPKVARIRGVRGKVEKLQGIDTAPVNIEGLTAPVSVMSRLVADKKDISTIDPQEVEVKIEVSKQSPVQDTTTKDKAGKGDAK